RCLAGGRLAWTPVAGNTCLAEVWWTWLAWTAETAGRGSEAGVDADAGKPTLGSSTDQRGAGQARYARLADQRPPPTRPGSAGTGAPSGAADLARVPAGA